jgi:CheY-like chemotaxis protein
MGTRPEENHTVLIVEDNAIAREGMAVVLRQAGYDVVGFPEAREALEYLGSNPPPDVILLDMIIPPPGGDGWWFVEQRKRIPGLDAVPLLLTTGLHVASLEWAASLGACGLVRKPIEAKPLLAEIRRCLTEPAKDKTESV